jgi:ribosomal protein S12 methylthiotransferase
VGLISLGCAKNLVDAEIMLGSLLKEGIEIVNDASQADAVIVNTCSFIDAAQEESVDTILEHNALREASHRGQALIVSGCMPQRYRDELPKLMPEVDVFMGIDQVEQVGALVNEAIAKRASRVEAEAATPKTAEGARVKGRLKELEKQAPAHDHADETALRGTDRFGKSRIALTAAPQPVGPSVDVTVRPNYIPQFETPRFRLTPKHFAYVKIAEGCNHTCTFCIIPQIRGRHRSRTQESVVKEVEALVKSGVKEINLISQDTTYFGMDQWEGERPKPSSPVDSSKGNSLCTLLREINRIEGDFWVRLLYTHPAHWSDELIQTIAECDKVAKYVDIPLQHISDRMLTAMKRVTSGDYIRDLLRRMRAGIPGIGIRTTFIVGFPGETEEDFNELLEFIREFRFERAGVFQYSKEEGTRAYKMDGHLHHATRKSRWSRAMAELQRIASENNQAQVGKKVRVLVEQAGVGRTQWDAPEIDGSVMVDDSIPVGSFADVMIGDWRGYDLVAAR